MHASTRLRADAGRRPAPSGADAAPGREQGAALIAQAAGWRVLATLHERARAARNLAELCFVIANETWQLLPYRQGIVWRVGSNGRIRLQTVSGLAQLGEDSPNTVWLKALGAHLRSLSPLEPRVVDAADCPAAIRAHWDEFLPGRALVHPLVSPSGLLLGVAAFAIDDAPDDWRQHLLARAFDGYGHAWAALLGPAARRPRARGGRRRWVGWAAAAAAIAAAFVPVRLSVLAPAEIIALDALAVSSPMDGVVREFRVQPNQAVRRDDVLFTLDDTTLRNRREVAARQLQVARADALAAAQKAFSNDASRAEIAALNGRVAERQAELGWLDEQLGRVEVRAAKDGIVVFGDVNDWQGKPVVTGERIALLGDPKDAGVLIWLPVADALNIEPGAPVRLFLQVAPLAPLDARLSQTSYQSVLSPDGVASYRLRARFEALDDAQRELARIGLKGTVKIYGDEASLGYYLLRRPLASLREFTGW
ncbi:MAG: efflux RND transporter periplasmic adaptor subunit [Lautropia sp.]